MPDNGPRRIIVQDGRSGAGRGCCGEGNRFANVQTPGHADGSLRRTSATDAGAGFATAHRRQRPG